MRMCSGSDEEYRAKCGVGARWLLKVCGTIARSRFRQIAARACETSDGYDSEAPELRARNPETGIGCNRICIREGAGPIQPR